MKHRFKKKCVSRGFSLVEILVSLGAFGLFAILVQSILVMGHSLRISHVNLIDTTQSVGVIKKIICSANSAFKIVSMDPRKTYSVTDKPKRTYHNSSFNREKFPFVFLDLLEINKELAQGFIRSTANRIMIEESKIGDTKKYSTQRNIEFEAPNFKSALYYKVFQDSHTIVKINTQKQSLGIQPVSGYIFASRCVENKKSSVVYRKKQGATFDLESLKHSSLYILEEKIRPYYFPKQVTSTLPAVRCCEDGQKCNTSGGKKNYIPRLYIIYLDIVDLNNLKNNLPSHPAVNCPPSSSEICKSLENAFFVKVVHIQEEPEWQDINNVWSAGFVFTTKGDLNNSQSVPFSLDMMFMKNHCLTSPLRIAQCPILSFGTPPELQAMLSSAGAGSNSYTMKDFIHLDVTGCAGYSSGLNSTSLIHL